MPVQLGPPPPERPTGPTGRDLGSWGAERVSGPSGTHSSGTIQARTCVPVFPFRLLRPSRIRRHVRPAVLSVPRHGQDSCVNTLSSLEGTCRTPAAGAVPSRPGLQARGNAPPFTPQLPSMPFKMTPKSLVILREKRTKTIHVVPELAQYLPNSLGSLGTDKSLPFLCHPVHNRQWVCRDATPKRAHSGPHTGGEEPAAAIEETHARPHRKTAAQPQQDGRDHRARPGRGARMWRRWDPRTRPLGSGTGPPPWERARHRHQGMQKVLTPSRGDHTVSTQEAAHECPAQPESRHDSNVH